ncbi:protein ZBED8-like [Melanaphis sacchari]|uniref:protein ZBED8-like n=1 Tax=Melanaphis sacchari TaxID=742174 RepID=UPI000DC144DF|nr:protein ZBED8-like [Melanaphis sacchari]
MIKDHSPIQKEDNVIYLGSPAVAKLPVETHNQLIELLADKTLQLQFASRDLKKFWIIQKNEYGSLVTEALKMLIPFATSYLCEKGFSSMVAIKTKC